VCLASIADMAALYNINIGNTKVKWLRSRYSLDGLVMDVPHGLQGWSLNHGVRPKLPQAEL